MKICVGFDELWVSVLRCAADIVAKLVLGLHESKTIQYFDNSLLSWSCQSIWKVLLSCLEILDHIGVRQTCDSKQVNH